MAQIRKILNGGSWSRNADLCKSLSGQGGPESLTVTLFRNFNVLTVPQVLYGEGSFPLYACWVKPLCIPVVEPEKALLGLLARSQTDH